MIPKFRAWDKKLKQMIKVISLNWYEHILDYNVVGLFPNTESVARFWDETIVMQSTGLKDKNGVEIFEGDIIHYLSVIRSKKDWYRKVVRRGSALVMMSFDEKEIDSAEYFNLGAGDKSLEVIGNIYENPELLERDT